MKLELRNLAEFIRSFAWPGVGAMALLMFRKQIADVLTQTAQRLRSAALPYREVQLSELHELPTSWSVGSMDVRKPSTSQIFNGASGPLLQQLLDSGKSGHYAVVDLGSGREWITSRIYVFALVLGMVRGLRALVFLESCHGTRRRFLGIASPMDVQKALAVRYPWMEEAWLKASVAQYPQDSTVMHGLMDSSNRQPLFAGADHDMVAAFLRRFIQCIQRTSPPAPGEEDAYLRVGTDPETWERGRWVDGERLERDLAGYLHYDWCENSPDKNPKTLAGAIARRGAPLVALVDSDRRFWGVVDRYSILDAIKQPNVKEV